ncbi:MAG: hydantoinase B/oxoprolinase family protein, partial [bacterium]|nr:hydantoinase B/oxoprolinase family protein [bacterium]
MNASKFDPVSLEVMWSRMINITEECWTTIWRTAFSTIIGEAQDFGCELLDAAGESLAHSPRSMPVFNLTLPRAVKALLKEFPPETLREGDALITNDPWICAGHLFDVAIVTPVFRKGRLVALVGSIAHCSDIGGTRHYQNVREVYEEGLQIPPMKLYDAGVPNRTLFTLLERNVRKSAMVLGDVHAQHGANLVARARLLAFLDAYDLDDLADLAHEVQARAERAMRDAISALPDGTYGSRVAFDGVGTPLELGVAIHVAGDSLRVEWEAPPQLARGGINCTLNYTAAHTVYALKSILTPDIPSNAGCFRPIDVVAPEGSMLNCAYPAAVNLRTHTGWYCAPAVFAALAKVLPNAVQAFTGLPMGAGAYGVDEDGTVFNDHLFQGGGQGAGARGDGKSALLYPTSAGNTSIEMFETRTPLVVEEKALITDSGGSGRHRGGLGQRVRVRKLRDDGQTALLSLHPQGMIVATPGLAGGMAGRRSSVALEGPDGRYSDLELDGMAELRTPSDVCTIELAGGSGFGDPAERDPEAH